MSDGNAIKRSYAIAVVAGQGRGGWWWRMQSRLHGGVRVVVKARRRFGLRTALALVALATVMIWAVNDPVLRSRWYRLRDRPIAAWDAVLAGEPSPRALGELHQVLLLVLADPNATPGQLSAALESLADLEPTSEELPLLRALAETDFIRQDSAWWSPYQSLMGALARHGPDVAPTILNLIEELEYRWRWGGEEMHGGSVTTSLNWSWSWRHVLNGNCIARMSEFLPAHLQESLRHTASATWTLPILVLFEPVADDQLDQLERLIGGNDEHYGLLGIQSMGERAAPAAAKLVQSMESGRGSIGAQTWGSAGDVMGGASFGHFLHAIASMGQSARIVIGDLERLASRGFRARVQPSFGACIVHLDPRNEKARQQVFSLLELNRGDSACAQAMDALRRQVPRFDLHQDLWCEENAWRILASELRDPLARALAAGRIEPALWVVSSLCLPEVDEWGMHQTPVDPTLRADMVEMLAQDWRIQSEVELLLQLLSGETHELQAVSIAESALFYYPSTLQSTGARERSMLASEVLAAYPAIAHLARPRLHSLIVALDRSVDPEIACNIIRALLAIDSSDPRVQAALSMALSFDDLDTRLLAANKLRSIGAPRSLWLAPRLRDLRNSCR